MDCNLLPYRYRTLEQLTADDFRAAPREWPDFWRGAVTQPWTAAYNLPESLLALQRRLEENLVYYLVRFGFSLIREITSLHQEQDELC